MYVAWAGVGLKLNNSSCDSRLYSLHTVHFTDVNDTNPLYVVPSLFPSLSSSPLSYVCVSLAWTAAVEA